MKKIQLNEKKSISEIKFRTTAFMFECLSRSWNLLIPYPVSSSSFYVCKASRFNLSPLLKPQNIVIQGMRQHQSSHFTCPVFYSQVVHRIFPYPRFEKVKTFSVLLLIHSENVTIRPIQDFRSTMKLPILSRLDLLYIGEKSGFPKYFIVSD